jgi:hypothetical protein
VNLYVQRTQLETRDKQAGGPRPGLIPIVAFVDQLRPHDGNQVIVLIPWLPRVTAAPRSCTAISSSV